ncbi:MAG: site-specific integrase [Bacteroidia bacterium]|nr:site-specific integrase [Bacteroidia bacterium]
MGKDFAPETVERYETSLMHTENFIKLFYKKTELPISQINHKFITDYELYFKTERNCSHNTTMKYIKNFRKIIRIALANGIIKTDPFSNFKMTIKKVDREYLNEEELEILLNKKFDFQRLEQVRDCFLFSCFTGLAHSDLKRLTKENIVTGTDGKLWVKINRKKTNNLSSIPILPITKSLIEKYAYNEYCMTHNVLLPVYTNQRMNAYLKELALICKINKNLSSHIARHTFATTVTLNNDVPIETVSKILGHSSINMIKIYARLLDKKVGNDIKHLHDKFSIIK